MMHKYIVFPSKNVKDLEATICVELPSLHEILGQTIPSPRETSNRDIDLAEYIPDVGLSILKNVNIKIYIGKFKISDFNYNREVRWLHYNHISDHLQVPFIRNSSSRKIYIKLYDHINRNIDDWQISEFHMKITIEFSDWQDIILILGPKAKQIREQIENMQRSVKISFYNMESNYFDKIYYWWKCILAKRRLQRLRLANEIEFLPPIGIKYIEAKTNYYQQLSSN